MSIDVLTWCTIHRGLKTVSGFAADPLNAPKWYLGVRSARMLTKGRLKVGSRASFTARFLGRTFARTYEVVAFEPGTRLVMRTAEGPFPMETSYEWQAEGEFSTCMRLRNRGEPAGIARWLAPLLSMAVRRSNRKDLASLKGLLESWEEV